jgi:hypothetical protein
VLDSASASGSNGAASLTPRVHNRPSHDLENDPLERLSNCWTGEQSCLPLLDT